MCSYDTTSQGFRWFLRKGQRVLAWLSSQCSIFVTHLGVSKRWNPTQWCVRAQRNLLLSDKQGDSPKLDCFQKFVLETPSTWTSLSFARTHRNAPNPTVQRCEPPMQMNMDSASILRLLCLHRNRPPNISRACSANQVKNTCAQQQGTMKAIQTSFCTACDCVYRS